MGKRKKYVVIYSHLDDEGNLFLNALGVYYDLESAQTKMNEEFDEIMNDKSYDEEDATLDINRVDYVCEVRNMESPFDYYKIEIDITR